MVNTMQMVGDGFVTDLPDFSSQARARLCVLNEAIARKSTQLCPSLTQKPNAVLGSWPGSRRGNGVKLDSSQADPGKVIEYAVCP